MVRYNIDDVTDDMILGESIFMPTGELLLAAGFYLTTRFRERLKQLGIQRVSILVEGTEEVVPERIISDHIQREIASTIHKGTQPLRQVFDVRREGVQHFRKLIRENKHYINKYLCSTGLSRTLEKLIDEILNIPSMVVNVSALQNTGEDLFSHAISVTTIALCIARKYHFSYEEMKQLAMGALNLDLGLVAIPKEIVQKSNNLSPDELHIYQQHPVYGFLMLSQSVSVAPTSAVVPLQHHEYQDGSGFPRGIFGENKPPLKDFSRKKVIHRFSEIVTVADTYDMLTTGRHMPQMTTPNAMRKIIEMGGTKLNSEIVKTFMTIVPVYPVGTMIRVLEAPSSLLIGYHGVVARDNPSNLEKPQLILYETKNRRKIKPILVDMARYEGFTIEVIT